MDIFPTANWGSVKFKTIKNVDENPDLPLDFKNLDRKPKV
jgi:hypothetical protein